MRREHPAATTAGFGIGLLERFEMDSEAKPTQVVYCSTLWREHVFLAGSKSSVMLRSWWPIQGRRGFVGARGRFRHLRKLSVTLPAPAAVSSGEMNDKFAVNMWSWARQRTTLSKQLTPSRARTTQSCSSYWMVLMFVLTGWLHDPVDRALDGTSPGRLPL